MLAWLNANIGADWATYLSLFIGIIGIIIGLVVGGKKLINSGQYQKVGGRNNAAMQAGGDIKKAKDDG